MKTYIITFLFSLVTIIGVAQIDRSQPPPPGPAPEIQLGDYELFRLENGLTVIVVENNKIPKISYSLYLDRDPVLEGEKAGYVELAGDLLGTATHTRSKDQIDEAIDYIGAELYTSASSASGSVLTKHNDEFLELFSDVVINARFNQEELDKLKKQALSSIEAAKNDASDISSLVTGKIVFGKDHPYGEAMTDSSLSKISLEDCRNYYQTYWRPNISYLAIVGDLSLDEAKSKIEKYFGKWEHADVPGQDYETVPRPEGIQVSLVHRENSVQSVIKIGYPVDLQRADDDYVSAMVMNKILGGGPYRLFDNLREKHAYTYGAYSSLSSDDLVGEFVAYTDVRNSVTDSAIIQIFHEMERLKAEPVTNAELQRVKNNINGNFALALEKPATIARFALYVEVYGLPKDYYKNYLKKVAAVTPDDLQEAAKKFLHPENCHVIVVGKKDEILEGLKNLDSNGKVDLYDNLGNFLEKL